MYFRRNDVPKEVYEGDNGVYGDVNRWIKAYIETGLHAVDFASIQKQNLDDVDIWVRDNTNWEFEPERHAHGVTN